MPRLPIFSADAALLRPITKRELPKTMCSSGSRLLPALAVGLGLLLLGASGPIPASPLSDGACVLAPSDPPEYYKIDLVPTKRVPTARRATGAAHVAFTPSPFGISISPQGHYVYDLTIAIDNLLPARDGAYVAWVSTPNLDEVQRIGVLDAQGHIAGKVAWNKFLVIITLEPSADPTPGWQGPVVLRGMSRSGMMHTMAGHGPFQQEPCASYGYR